MGIVAPGCLGLIGGTPSDDEETQDLEEETAEVQAAVSGMRRLTVREYNNTVRDLVGDDSSPAHGLFPEDVLNPFDNDYTTQIPSTALVDAAELLAGQIAERLASSAVLREDVLGCQPSGPTDVACLRTFIERFGPLALRRPLLAEEVDELTALSVHGVAADDFYRAVETVLRTLLQTPEFLYRVERGDPLEDAPGVFRLNAYETATRLAYFLWASAPDTYLMEVAGKGDLDTAEGVATVARAMLTDPRARTQMDRFHALWLGYDNLPHPGELTSALRQETSALIDRVVFEDAAPWAQLFTYEETYISPFLADHYGLADPADGKTNWVSYADSGRAGLLSHGSFLSGGAKFDDTSPVQRGILVRTRLLCQDVPPPPENVNADDKPLAENSNCKWDAYAAHREGGCASCHAFMDPIGFGLENYDESGRFREYDDGFPECIISGDGEVSGVGTFNGPAELAQLTLESGLLPRCLVTQLYRYGVGRYALDTVDMANVDALSVDLDTDVFRLQDVVVDLVSSEAFRLRRDETVEGQEGS